MSNATQICKCGATMVRREPGTPEQAWCGTWYECPKAKAPHTEKHLTVLIPSQPLVERYAAAGGAT